jgi:hypothetical protein
MSAWDNPQMKAEDRVVAKAITALKEWVEGYDGGRTPEDLAHCLAAMKVLQRRWGELLDRREATAIENALGGEKTKKRFKKINP